MSQYGQGFSASRQGGVYEPHRGTLILALGIAGLLAFCGLTSPFAWWMGRNDLKKIASGQMDPSGESMTRAGHLIGIIGTVIATVPAILGLFFAAIWFVAVLVLGIAAQSGI